MSSSSIDEGDEGGEGDVAVRALEVGDDGSADRVRAEEAPLVTLVQSGTAGQKEQAAGALGNLAINAENKVLIAQAGAIAPLVTLVQSGTDGQKEQAAGALGNLAINSENQVLIAQAGG